MKSYVIKTIAKGVSNIIATGVEYKDMLEEYRKAKNKGLKVDRIQFIISDGEEEKVRYEKAINSSEVAEEPSQADIQVVEEESIVNPVNLENRVQEIIDLIDGVIKDKKYVEQQFNIKNKELNDISHTLVNVAEGRLELTPEERLQLMDRQIKLEKEFRYYKEQKKTAKGLFYKLIPVRGELEGLKQRIEIRDKKVSGFNHECKTIEKVEFKTDKERVKIVSNFRKNSFYNKIVINHRDKVITAYRKLVTNKGHVAIENIY